MKIRSRLKQIVIIELDSEANPVCLGKCEEARECRFLLYLCRREASDRRRALCE
jgi:hypothetical protein